ncbi:MAG TPA: hypothetical protein VNO18_03205 [Xanthobacteraceae bacterium]|nr:hypothetical protein [Xanthobacteraceae bacterium]
MTVRIVPEILLAEGRGSSPLAENVMAAATAMTVVAVFDNDIRDE